MTTKLAHMWKKNDNLRRESDSYNSKEVNFSWKDNENNQQIKWWENFMETTKQATIALRLLPGLRAQHRLSSALSNSYQQNKKKTEQVLR
jgi:hypothetical protein